MMSETQSCTPPLAPLSPPPPAAAATTATKAAAATPVTSTSANMVENRVLDGVEKAAVSILPANVSGGVSTQWVTFDDHPHEEHDSGDMPSGAAGAAAAGVSSGSSAAVASAVTSAAVSVNHNANSDAPPTIKPSSIEVVAANAQPATASGTCIRTDPVVSDGSSGAHRTSSRPHVEVRIEPNFVRRSPPRSPIVALPSSRGVVGRPSLTSIDTTKYVNGDVICTVWPVNKSCAWVTRAKFRPNHVPEEIMDTKLTVTVEDYVLAMEILTNDVRFTVYNVLYKRVLILWLALGFTMLLSLLFSGRQGLALFGGGIFWLIVNATGIFVCMWIKFKLYHMLERCVAHVNQMMIKHDILIGLDDRGRLSCHKVHLIFVFFQTDSCIRHLCAMLEDQEKADSENTAVPNPVVRSRMDLGTENEDIIVTRGSVMERISQKEKIAEKLLLRYSQRWVKEFVRKRLDLSVPVHPDGFPDPGPPAPPRHCSMARCPCQFIEEHLRFKPLTRWSWSEFCC